MPDIVLQFETTIERQKDELDELTERLQQQHEMHQQSVTELQSEHQLKLDEVLWYLRGEIMLLWLVTVVSWK